MIDLHAHLLPGLDDGPADLAGSLELARAMVDAGITQVAASPHIFASMGWTPTRAQVLEAGARLRAALEAADVPLAVLPSAEHFYDESLPGRLQAGEGVPINLRRFALVELSTTQPPPDVPAALYRLRRLGVEPLLAHVERYPGLGDSPERARVLFAQGYALQVDVGALVGQFGRGQQRAAWQLLEQGLVAVVASDAHTVSDVAGSVERARRELERRLGAPRTRALLVDTPARICAGETLDLGS